MLAGSPLIEARGLRFGHRGRVVGMADALSLGPGRVLCLLGPNGGGKTTLLRTLLGLIAPLGGSIAIEGRELARLSRREVARGIAYVPQQSNPAFAHRVEELVVMGRTASLGTFEAPGEADRIAAREALQRLGIAHLGHRNAQAISGGERQMVLIARALAAGAPAMILDEPTASLDFGNQARVLETIGQLAAEGKGVLFTTHDPSQALAIAHSVLLLEPVADGPSTLRSAAAPETAITPDALRALYGVEVTVERLSDGRRVAAPALRRVARDD